MSVFGVFLVCIFPHSDWIWRDTPYFSARYHGPKKLLIRALFAQWGSLTSPTGYTEIIDKTIYVVNNSVSCIDPIFCTNKNVISKYSVDVSIFW